MKKNTMSIDRVMSIYGSDPKKTPKKRDAEYFINLPNGDLVTGLSYHELVALRDILNTWIQIDGKKGRNENEK